MPHTLWLSLTSLARTLARATLPPSLRGWVRSRHRAFMLDAALRQLAKLPPDSACPESLLNRLIRGWGNEGFGGTTSLMRAIDYHLAVTTGDVLDCGSGLSTIFLGIRTENTGRRVLSLEHDRGWADKVQVLLDRQGLSHVALQCAPLRPFDGYDWYDVDASTLGAYKIGLAIVDGPPGPTRGNRYGMLPNCRPFLTADATIVLDDVSRPEERQVFAAWLEDERAMELERGTNGQVGILQLSSREPTGMGG